MSVALLWIEVLAASLLFSAMEIAWGARRKQSSAAVRFLAMLVALLPMIPLGLAAVMTCMLRYVSGARGSTFFWAAALVAAYLVGLVWMHRAARRNDGAGGSLGSAWPLGRIASAWLVVLLLIAMTYWNMELRVQMEVQALRMEAGALALSVMPPQISDAANAQFLYRQSDEGYKAATRPADDGIDARFVDVRTAQVADYLSRQQKTLEILRRAADMPDCRIDYDFLNPDILKMMQEAGPFRARANLLVLAARAEAAAGDVDLALADGRRIFALGTHASSPALLVNGLVSIALDVTACRTLAQVLPFLTTREQLARVVELDPRAMPRLFAQTLRGEEAFGLAQFCDIASGRAVTPDRATGWSQMGGAVMWQLWIQDVVGSYRENMQRMRTLCEQPYYQVAAEHKLLEAEGQSRGNAIAAMFIPSIAPSLHFATDAEAMRCAVTLAVAATKYRLEHMEYPASADALAPQWIDAVPLDPYDGRPLRCKRLDDGSLVIYSVGLDQVDNGGDVDWKPRANRVSDVGLILRMPGK